jgi:hypothetical protein
MPAVKISALFEQIRNWQNFAAHFYNYKVCGEVLQFSDGTNDST